MYNVEVHKYHELTISAGGYGQEKLKARNMIEFLNSEDNGLGMAFPKGVIRVFKEDEDDGSLEFVGEDRIDHTPKDENITIFTGNAFDIVANKYAIDRRSMESSGYSANMNMTIKNHKSTEAEVIVKLTTYYGDNLRITWNTPGVELEKVTANLFKFTKVLQADEEFTAEWKEDYRR